MAAVVRIYEDASNARSAYSALLDAGFSKNFIAMLVPERGQAADPQQTDSMPGSSSNETKVSLASAVKIGGLIGPDAGLYQGFVDRGYSLLAVSPSFGSASVAIDILNSFSPYQPVQQDLPVEIESRSGDSKPAPLSAALGFSVLTDHRASMSGAFGLPELSARRRFMVGELGNPHFNFSAKFGFQMLSSKPAPLSSMLGWPVKSGKSGSGWTRSMGFRMLSDNAAPLSGFFGIPLISGRNDSRDYAPLRHRRAIRNNPAPLSNLLGLPTLSKGHSFLSSMFAPLTKHNWALTSGMGLLSHKPAPLSAMLNLKVLKNTSGGGSTRLSRNPAPLSSALGLSVLTKE